MFSFWHDDFLPGGGEPSANVAVCPAAASGRWITRTSPTTLDHSHHGARCPGLLMGSTASVNSIQIGWAMPDTTTSHPAVCQESRLEPAAGMLSRIKSRPRCRTSTPLQSAGAESIPLQSAAFRSRGTRLSALWRSCWPGANRRRCRRIMTSRPSAGRKFRNAIRQAFGLRMAWRCTRRDITGDVALSALDGRQGRGAVQPVARLRTHAPGRLGGRPLRRGASPMSGRRSDPGPAREAAGRGFACGGRQAKISVTSRPSDAVMSSACGRVAGRRIGLDRRAGSRREEAS